MRLLVTGGAGFIGSHVLKFLTNTYPDYVRALESRVGVKVGCIEEAALSTGLIDSSQVAARAEKLSNTSYGDYLTQLVQFYGGK